MRPGTLRQITEDKSLGYINRLAIKSIAGAINVAAGRCVDDTNTYLMLLNAPISINPATSGINGLDTGTITANTWYYVWLLGQTAPAATGGILSLSDTTPVMPPDYNRKQIIGTARINGSGILHNFIQYRIGNRNEVWWLEEADTTLRVLAGGAATVFTAVNLAAFVSPKAIQAFLQAEASTQELRIEPGGLTSYFEVASGSHGQFPCLMDGGKNIYYRNAAGGGSSNIEVLGYTEEL